MLEDSPQRLENLFLCGVAALVSRPIQRRPGNGWADCH
jgi:hypothetical protein